MSGRNYKNPIKSLYLHVGRVLNDPEGSGKTLLIRALLLAANERFIRNVTQVTARQAGSP
jgi:hypothetical protein